PIAHRGSPKTRPPCPRIELLLRPEQHRPAPRASIHSVLVIIPITTRVRDLRAAVAQNPELHRRQTLLPFLFAQNQLPGPRRRIGQRTLSPVEHRPEPSKGERHRQKSSPWHACFNRPQIHSPPPSFSESPPTSRQSASPHPAPSADTTAAPQAT